jgi:hypothetical protein
MMCDGEDRIVVGKKKAGSGGGDGGVIKLNVFRQNALTDQRRRQNRVGNVWLQGFSKFEKGKGAGRALLGSGGRELRATVFAERLPFVPCVLQSFQSLELELAEISSLLSSSGQIEWQSSQGISIWTEEQRKPALSPVVVVWCAALPSLHSVPKLLERSLNIFDERAGVLSPSGPALRTPAGWQTSGRKPVVPVSSPADKTTSSPGPLVRTIFLDTVVLMSITPQLLLS